MKHRALQWGEVGLMWLNEVEKILAEVATAWSLEIGSQLSGGTEALVFEARGSSGPSVLKLGIPNSMASETAVLRIADGSGYAKLLEFDSDHDAILIERLGAQLAQSQLTADHQIEILCDTLKLGWRCIEASNAFLTGAQKAQSQADYILTEWEAHGRPCARQIIDQALAYTSERIAAHATNPNYLVHGDAHIWNTLSAPDSLADS